ncbi:MAG: hypothetical protein LUC90_08680 [Lachnospiraceae bacterium]|nr:hypothetical protein [Lachnospiraceae bacterium]
MEPKLCIIREIYFQNNSNFVKVLDTENTDKQSRRTHLCIMIEQEQNRFFIPLRNNLGPDVRKFGRIGHALPSNKRENAGLDYRYALIVNDDTYLEWQTDKKNPKSQYQKINNEYDAICAEFCIYLRGFIKSVKKQRHFKEPLYRESSLINFVKELGIK